MSSRRSLLKTALLAVGVAAFVAGCGFHVRGSTGGYSLPFTSIFLTFSENSPLGAELKRNIRANPGTEIAASAKDAQAVMEILGETRDKTILSLNSQGRVREFLLTYSLRFRVRDNKDHEFLAPTEIALKRSINFNEAQVLGKEAEEALLYRDMQTDLVQQILRRLAAIPVPAFSPAPAAAPAAAPASAK